MIVIPTSYMLCMVTSKKHMLAWLYIGEYSSDKGLLPKKKKKEVQIRVQLRVQ